MQGRGRGQLPPFYKAATFLLRDSVSTSSSIASVTYDDPNGSWESWEPGAGWGSIAGGGRSATSPSAQTNHPERADQDAAKSEPDLRWDEDGDTNLRHPKQLPRTLITMSELDWEDSEECATELWQHPQRSRNGRGEASGQRLQARGTPARSVQPAVRTGAAGRAAEPTARWNTAAPELLSAQRTSAPQRLPKAPPPRAAEPDAPEAPNERRGRTTTRPGAAPGHAGLHQPPTAAALSADAEFASALSADPRSASVLSAGQHANHARLDATLSLDTRAATPHLSAARAAAQPRSLTQTQVSGFGMVGMVGMVGMADQPPPPAGRASVPRAANVLPAPPSPVRSEAPPAPAIESLRQRLITPRLLPPRVQGPGHTPTILGTPAAGAGRAAPVPQSERPQRSARVQPPAASADSSQAVEQLQEQLLEAMARARVQEARAAEAEKSVEQVEEQLETIVRTQLSESEQLRDQLNRTHSQLRVTEARAVEAERRSVVPPRPQTVLHLAEAELTPRHPKQGRANLILSGLLASSLSFGGAAYFMFYAPLQKQLVALEQQRAQDAQAQANLLTNAKAQSAAERQGLEAQNSELRSQLEAARAEALAMNASDEGKRGRSRRASSMADSDSAEETPAGTRSARAIERRMRRSRAAEQTDGDESEAPARSSRSSRDGNDPLDGL